MMVSYVFIKVKRRFQNLERWMSMKVLVTASCSKVYNVKNVEEAEKLFREEIGQKLRPEKIHSVIGMDCSDDE